MIDRDKIKCDHCEHQIDRLDDLALRQKLFKIAHYHKDCFEEIFFDIAFPIRLLKTKNLRSMGRIAGVVALVIALLPIIAWLSVAIISLLSGAPVPSRFFSLSFIVRAYSMFFSPPGLFGILYFIYFFWLKNWYFKQADLIEKLIPDFQRPTRAE